MSPRTPSRLHLLMTETAPPVSVLLQCAVVIACTASGEPMMFIWLLQATCSRDRVSVLRISMSCLLVFGLLLCCNGCSTVIIVALLSVVEGRSMLFICSFKSSCSCVVHLLGLPHWASK